MNKLLLCALLALSGCATKLPQPSVRLPYELTQPCAQLSKLEGTTGADLLHNIVANAQTYYKCADAHSKLIEAVTPKK